MNRLLILGATGRTGQQLVAQALQQGCLVTAVARNPSRLSLTHPNLRTVACDVTANAGGLGEIVRDHDVAISALGRGTSLRSEHLIERSMRNLVPTLERHGPRRFIVLSGFGVGETYRAAPRVLRLLFRTLLANIYADKAAGEAVIRASTLDWTIVYAAYLTNRPASGAYEMGDDLPPTRPATVSRADAAGALLSCIASPSTIGKGLELRSVKAKRAENSS